MTHATQSPRSDHQSDPKWDLIIVGAGPAGLAAGAHAASAGLATVMVEAQSCGGQARPSTNIENCLDFPTGISGAEMMNRLTTQSLERGARITVPVEAIGLDHRDGTVRVGLADDGSLIGRAVIIATGVHYRRLPIADLGRFEGASVHYAATQTEAQRWRGQKVVLVGDDMSAGEAALLLSDSVHRLTIVCRDGDLLTHMTRDLADHVAGRPNVDVLTQSEVRGLSGDAALEAVVVQNTQNREYTTIAAHAMFVLIGTEPRTGWVRDTVALDDGGYVLTGQTAVPPAADTGTGTGETQPALALQTSLPGVFAAGDVRSGSMHCVAAAVDDGANATSQVRQLLRDSA